jgi:predicted GNAT superfamily acetyltransferase
VPIIFGGVTYPRLIVVNRTVAAPIAGGTAGSTSFTDQTWDNISSTSFVQVTDTGAQIVSDSSGRIRFQASAGYEGSGEATIKAQHSTDGTTWTDGTSPSTGTLADDSDPFEPLFGFVGLGPTTVTGLSASTNYFVRLVAKLEAGGSSVSWINPTFTANHP